MPPLWLALAAVVVVVVFFVWIMRKASKRMDENAEFKHKSGLPPWMG
jgi:membrane protein implicated in regulation of membrane protease activity